MDSTYGNRVPLPLLKLLSRNHLKATPDHFVSSLLWGSHIGSCGAWGLESKAKSLNHHAPATFVSVPKGHFAIIYHCPAVELFSRAWSNLRLFYHPHLQGADAIAVQILYPVATSSRRHKSHPRPGSSSGLWGRRAWGVPPVYTTSFAPGMGGHSYTYWALPVDKLLILCQAVSLLAH